MPILKRRESNIFFFFFKAWVTHGLHVNEIEEEYSNSIYIFDGQIQEIICWLHINLMAQMLGPALHIAQLLLKRALQSTSMLLKLFNLISDDLCFLFFFFFPFSGNT